MRTNAYFLFGDYHLGLSHRYKEEQLSCSIDIPHTVSRSMSYNTTPTTKDLSILDPELRGIISFLPTTSEAATDPQTVVNYMRAIPAPPHDDPNIVKKEILISPPDALPEQPPTSVRIFIPKELEGKGPLPVVLWSVSCTSIPRVLLVRLYAQGGRWTCLASWWFIFNGTGLSELVLHRYRVRCRSCGGFPSS